MLIKSMYCCADVHLTVFYLVALRDAFSKVQMIIIIIIILILPLLLIIIIIIIINWDLSVHLLIFI